MNIKTVTEGITETMVPIPPEDASFPPSAAPVFYNPEMELNRDISVAATSAFVKRLVERRDIPPSQITYVDALSASGIRGLRIAKEVGVATTLNDWSAEAYDLILQNIEMNDLSETTTASRKNANVLLHESKYNIVDLDPFGTASPFLDSAASAAINMLEITATDTAPLCGAHLNSGIRKYAAVPLNNEYHAEMGVRILLGAAARELAKHEKEMIPLLCHATRHYVRLYLEVKKGAKRADKSLKKMGFISHCSSCGFRTTISGLAPHIEKDCPHCEGVTTIAGPLWLGELHDPSFCQEVLDEIEERPLGSKEIAKKIITFCRDELDMPTFYDQHVICKEMGVSAASMDMLMEFLKDQGFKASRTHFSGTSFKTDASLEKIKEIIRAM